MRGWRRIKGNERKQRKNKEGSTRMMMKGGKQMRITVNKTANEKVWKMRRKKK